MLSLGRILPPVSGVLDILHKAYPELFSGKLRSVGRQRQANPASDRADLSARHLESDYRSLVRDVTCRRSWQDRL